MVVCSLVDGCLSPGMLVVGGELLLKCCLIPLVKLLVIGCEILRLSLLDWRDCIGRLVTDRLVTGRLMAGRLVTGYLSVLQYHRLGMLWEMVQLV